MTEDRNKTNKCTAANERVYARRKCSVNLQLPAPQEVQWKPQPRKAAATLCASGGSSASREHTLYLQELTV